MNLGIEFIVLSFMIILFLIPLYIYRKRLLKFYYTKKNLSMFAENLKIYLSTTFTKITFDFDILEKVKSEKDSRIEQVLIVEDMISQFTNFEYETQTQTPIASNLLWSSYEFDSKLANNKAPKDLIRRKELVWRRDNQQCDRCGQKTKLLETHLYHIKALKDGGTYHFENLSILCSDCHRITNTNSSIEDLIFQDNLMKKVSF